MTNAGLDPEGDHLQMQIEATEKIKAKQVAANQIAKVTELLGFTVDQVNQFMTAFNAQN